MRRTGVREYFLNAGPVQVVQTRRVTFFPRKTSRRARVLH